jgi:hypothetical protein
MTTTSGDAAGERLGIRKRLEYLEPVEAKLPEPLHPVMPDVPNELGYSRALVHLPRGWNGASFVGAVYVKRRCDGCERTLKFTPLPGAAREQHCSVCHRRTLWRVVA